MCGIFGIVRFDNNDSVDPFVIETMGRQLGHRGPDDEGVFLDGNMGLGHRRLSIIDRSGGRQPMFNEDESAVVVLNGEIYNYRDLVRDLTARGHRFRTRSDTETIVHGYEEFGLDVVQHLRGMFGFAIWDRRLRRLLIARDRLGEKPVYYFSNESFLAFASEIKALLQLPEINREVDREALELYLELRYVPAPRTMFRNIRKLEPGCTLVAEAGRVVTRRYWDLRFEKRQRTISRAVEEFRNLFDQSVEMRLMSEVPLGVFLSGGLDSTAILSRMSHHAEAGKLRTFTVGYGTDGTQPDGNVDDSNEFEHARVAARRFGTEHHELRIGPTDFRDILPSLVWHLDEPLADPSCIPLYHIARFARRHATVVLSGEGADETMAGYGIYRKMLAMNRMSTVPGFAAATGRLARFSPWEKLRTYMERVPVPLEQRYRGVSFGVRPGFRRFLLGCGTTSGPGAEALFESLFFQSRGGTALDQMLYADTRAWLPDDLLMKADKMTMAHGMELRVPFLDHKLVEFAASLPDDQKIRRGQGKVLLREAVRGRVPPQILRRSKKGFPVPTRSWLGGRLKNMPRELLLDRGAHCHSLLDPAAISRIVCQHETGYDRAQDVWTLVVFESWLRTVFASPIRTRPKAPVAVG